MEHARTLLQDALEVLAAATAVTNPSFKEVLAQAALSAAEQAAAELRRYLQPNPAPPSYPILDLTPIEPAEEEEGSVSPTDLFEPPPTPNYSNPYLYFVAAMVPVLRAANPADTQQTHMTRIGELWQQYKGVSLQEIIAAATEDVLSAAAA